MSSAPPVPARPSSGSIFQPAITSKNPSISPAIPANQKNSNSAAAATSLAVSDSNSPASVSLSLVSQPPFNRFVDDFSPPIPSPFTPLVSHSISQFSKRLQVLTRQRIKFDKIRVKRPKLLDFEVDEKHRSAAASGGAGDAKSKGGKKAKKTGELDKIFKSPAVENEKPATDAENAEKKEETAVSSGASSEVKSEEKEKEKDSSSSEIKFESVPTPVENLAVNDDLVTPFLESQKIDAAVARSLVLDSSSSLTEIGFSTDSSSSQIVSESVFWRFHPSFEYSQTLETSLAKRIPVPFWHRLVGLQFLASVKSLNFGIGNLEPFFCTLTLIDLKSNTRISEDFHFDLNDSSILTGQLLVAHSMADALTQAKHAIFNVQDRHDGICLAIRIEKVLQGDPAESSEIYIKSRTRTIVDIQALGKKIRNQLVYMWEYRQPFAWSAIQLFEESGEWKNNLFNTTADSGSSNVVGGGIVKFDKLYSQPDSLKDELFISMVKETLDDGGKKQKIIPFATFELAIEELDSAMPANRIDPSSIAIKPTELIKEIHHIAELNTAVESTKVNSLSQSISSQPPLVKEIQEFIDYSNPNQLIPHTHFVNLLYIYPELIKFEKFRNLTCKIQLKCEDSHINSSSGTGISSDGLKVIKGKSSMTDFNISQLTQVNYHKKSVQPQDEIKLMLPLHLTPQYHLFFTFYQVSCKTKPGSRELIGYSVLPIFHRNRLIHDGQYELPIAAKMGSGYLSSFNTDGKDSDDIQFRHSGQKSFSIRIKSISSIFNSDEGINNFIQTFPNEKEFTAAGISHGKELSNRAIESLNNSNPIQLILFFPSLIDEILEFIVNRHLLENQIYAFLSLNSILKRISEHYNEPTPRCSVIEAFLTHRLDNPSPASHSTNNSSAVHPLYCILLELFAAAIEKFKDIKSNEDSDDRIRELINFSWFYFESVFKSLTIQCKSNQNNNNSINEDEFNRFSLALNNLIDLLIDRLANHRTIGLATVRQLINSIALFFGDLLTLLPPLKIFPFIERFCTQFRSLANSSFDPILIELKFSFYSILLDFEYFLDCIGIRTIDINKEFPDNLLGDSLLSAIESKFRLPALFTTDFISHLTVSEPFLLDRVINSLRFFLTKIDFDSRWQSYKPVIALAFMPLLCSIIQEGIDIINGLELKSRRNLLISIVWIISHLPKSFVRKWWNSIELDEGLNEMIQLFIIMIESFQYSGQSNRENHESIEHSIVSPETHELLLNESGIGTGTTGPQDLKVDLESLLINKQIRSFRRAAAASSSSSSSTGSQSNSTSSSTLKNSSVASGKSTLRQVRASQLRGGLDRSNNSVGSSAGRSIMKTVNNSGDQSVAGGGPTQNLSQSEEIQKLLRWEGALCRDVSRSVLILLDSFLEDFRSSIDSNPQTLEKLLSLFISYFSSPQSNSILLAILPTFLVFLQFHAHYCHNSDGLKHQLSRLSNEIFRYLTFSNPAIRSLSLVILHQLLLNEYLLRSEFPGLQNQLTLSLSKLTESLEPIQERRLIHSLTEWRSIGAREISWHSAVDRAVKKPSTGQNFNNFQSKFEVLIARLLTILNDSMEISRQIALGSSADSSIRENLLLQVAEAFDHLPEVKIQWLQRLSHHHQEVGNHAEAGQCLIGIAELHQRMKSQAASEEESATGAGEEKPLIKRSIGFPIPYDSRSLLLSETLKSACKQLDLAELYEQCTVLYDRLIPIYQYHNDYSSLSASHSHLKEIYEKLILATKTESRMLGTYYRIGFYGKKFGERLNGKEFIYKLPKITRLSEIAGALKTLYSGQLGCAVRILPDSGPVDVSKIDPAEAVLQVTFVNPVPDFGSATAKRRLSFIEQNTNISAFKYSTPFTATGKAFGSVGEQQKRNTILIVANPFPHRLTSQIVVKRVENILSPIESATEDVRIRSESLIECISNDPINVKSLTALLAGSVATQVHGGAREVCQTFLEGKVNQSDDEETEIEPAVAALQLAMNDFLSSCDSGLAANRKLAITDSEKEFQSTLDNEFHEMTKQIRPLLGKGKKKKNKEKTKVNFENKEK